MISLVPSAGHAARMVARWASAVLAIALLGETRVAPGATVRPRPRVALAAAPESSLWMEMRNVDLHIDERHVMHMRTLHGQVIPTVPGATAWLDDPKSFHLRATSGVVALDASAITTLLNTVTFNYPGAPIKNLEVRIENGMLIQRGKLHKGVDLPFEMRSRPALEPDGRLRLHPDKLRIFSVNGLTLIHALGLHLDQLMDLSRAKGASVKGDDLFIDPLQLIPPPAVQGRLATVRIEDTLLVQEFVRLPEDTVFGTFVRPDSGVRNFVYFRGGSLRFGRLTMTDTDLLINDDDESDPLDLNFADYNRQLVAGHTKNLADFGLRTWMVDYHRLPTRAVAARK